MSEKPIDRFNDSGLKPVEDDPWAELFADCTTTEDVLQLQAEIDAVEATE